jgi:hypothetical protein
MKFTAGRGWGSACINQFPQHAGLGLPEFYSIASFASREA